MTLTKASVFSENRFSLCIDLGWELGYTLIDNRNYSILAAKVIKKNFDENNKIRRDFPFVEEEIENEIKDIEDHANHIKFIDELTNDILNNMEDKNER